MPAAVMEQKGTDGWKWKFPGSRVPCRWSGVQGLSVDGELFKWEVWKRERLHLSHILFKAPPADVFTHHPYQLTT